MSKIDKQFIVNLQGKDFVTYEGLLDLAHQEGLTSIKTELVQLPTQDNNNQCIMKAIAYTEKGQFEGYGDADNVNVTGMVKKHLIRMAETRAKARALRDLTNVGMTALEEMGGEDNKPNAKPSNNNKSSNKASSKQLGFIKNLAKKKEYSFESISKYIKQEFDKSNSKELTKQEASQLIEMLNNIGDK